MTLSDQQGKYIANWFKLITVIVLDTTVMGNMNVPGSPASIFFPQG